MFKKILWTFSIYFLKSSLS